MKKVIFLLIILVGALLPNIAVIPVLDASPKDWNKYSYWFSPWGDSGVHKGIDIFAKKGTPSIASTSGMVMFKGKLRLGGNVVVILGPKWRIHYYAHLQKQHVHVLEWVKRGEKIGMVGNTGNAANKPSHLHYSIFSLIPSIGEITLEPEGWKRMFYVNPTIAFAKQEPS